MVNVIFFSKYFYFDQLNLIFEFADESNGSDNLYHEENDIDEESTPINSTSSENGQTFGVVAPEVIEASSYIYNRSSRTSSVS